jgi:hypothetical protein
MVYKCFTGGLLWKFGDVMANFKLPLYFAIAI